MRDLRLHFTAPEPARPGKPPVPFGRLLVNAGLIDQADLVHALEQQDALGVPLGDILVAKGKITWSHVADALSLQHQIQRIDLQCDPPSPMMAAHLSALDCLRHRVVPWRSLGNTILIATSAPDAFDAVRELASDGMTLLPVIAEDSQISQGISDLHGPSLARRAALRVPPVESCRTWQVGKANRTAGAAALVMLLAVLAMMEPARTITILMIWALCTSFLTVSLRSLSLFAQMFAIRPPPSSPASVPAPLPRVSVLVPLLREKEIATALIARLGQLTYPKTLLQIVLVLEEGDTVTRDTIARTSLPPWFDVIEVPQANRLQTKPRALNYALDFCKGSIIGVWDAEDAPEVDQIDRVVAHFAEAPANVACVQGILDYYNARTNWISRCFTIEYASWWRVILPGIARLGLILPLGGTTLFFKRDILEQLCGWDAHNVTEDADLGVRLARHGYKTDLLPTVTFEEANFRAWPWVKQRSRWLKGFLITWCVHMRQPLKLLREVGIARFLGIQTLFLATFSQFICAPLLWTFCLTLAGVTHPVEATLGTPMLAGLFYFFIFAEALNMVIAAKAVGGRDHRHLLPWILALPFYFILGTFAAYKALYEFVVSPFYWDKTEHGVAGNRDAIPPATASAR